MTVEDIEGHLKFLSKKVFRWLLYIWL